LRVVWTPAENKTMRGGASPPTMKVPTHYFAYGSNLRSAQMDRLCPGNRFLGPARLADHRLAFTLPDEEWEGGVADVVADHGGEVWGALYALTSGHLAALDEYEMCHADGDPALSAYVRRTITVHGTGGLARDGVWCYFVQQPQGHVPPSELYRRALLEGARERALPSTYLAVMRAAFEGPGNDQASLA
jgi:gamma-glutamylcyclotransferase (GGCT)/AIG2-like uncharacterized protein YtfP